jgi:3-methyladenine DNA glycosylase AlkD
MNILQEVIRKVKSVQHGFKVMKEEAERIQEEHNHQEMFTIAKELYTSDIYQVRMTATFLLGMVASQIPEAFLFLHDTVSTDTSWQVQEILAQAFDQYCKNVGYEKALPIIKQWLKDKNPNIKRAVSEGLRIWNTREYFKQHPDTALTLLSQLKDDESEYVRKSAGNAIRDISRKEKELVKNELETWDRSNKKIAFTYALASKFL